MLLVVCPDDNAKLTYEMTVGFNPFIVKLTFIKLQTNKNEHPCLPVFKDNVSSPISTSAG